MRRIAGATLLLGVVFAVSCADRPRVTLPEIDISTSPDGIVALPDDVPEVFREHFVQYTKVVAPNGKPIHILAQDGWTRDQIQHGREVLEFLLTDHPGSVYGSDKTAVANAMADRKATMVFFDTEDDLMAAFDGGLGDATDLAMQDLRANESPAVGDPDYMAHATRDASYEEIWHLVHDYGVKATLPEMIAEMRVANDAAAESGWKAWPDDEPEEHPNEYVGVLIDNYYDLWTVHPTLYEAREIEPGDIPAGHSHFGRYFANSREAMEAEDPAGYALIRKFVPPYLTYFPELPESFTGEFSLELDPDVAYTRKTQHLRGAKLTGSKDADLTGNGYENLLVGNAGSNVFTGGPGDDTLEGREGEDTAVFSGPSAEYEISRDGEATTVTDLVDGRDDTDTLRGVEFLRFGDETLAVAAVD